MIEVCRLPAILVVGSFLISPFVGFSAYHLHHRDRSTHALQHQSLLTFTRFIHLAFRLCDATPHASSSITQLALVPDPLLAQTTDQRYLAAASAHPQDHRSISHHVQLFFPSSCCYRHVPWLHILSYCAVIVLMPMALVLLVYVCPFL